MSKIKVILNSLVVCTTELIADVYYLEEISVHGCLTSIVII